MRARINSFTICRTEKCAGADDKNRGGFRTICWLMPLMDATEVLGGLFYFTGFNRYPAGLYRHGARHFAPCFRIDRNYTGVMVENREKYLPVLNK